MRGILSSLVPLALLGPLLSEGVGRPEAPANAAPPVDAAVATAIDLSDSIMRHHEWLQFEGIARAVLNPGFLDAVSSGQRGRISFAVFTWSSHGRHRVIVPWTLIDGPESALEVATRLRRVPRPTRFGGRDEKDRARPLPERRTDLSAAIRFGAVLLDARHRQSGRQVLNMISNGVDNVAGGAGAARDDAVAAGITINGVVLGNDLALAAYFRSQVAGGAGSFVMRVADPRAFTEVMRTKFLRDLIARPAPAVKSLPAPA